MDALRLEEITKTFPDGTTALRGISIAIEKGSFVSIMGSSGSGKSTLLNILGFLDRQTKGEYFFEEKNSYDYTEDDLAHIRNAKMGFIFQSFNLLNKSSVRENVLLPLQYSMVLKSEWQKRTDEVIRSVGLAHRMEHNVNLLSGGEKQRVAIARALVNNPDVIFADEPTGNLDSQSGQTIMEIIQKLNKEQNKTIILVTHESYASRYAERIIRLHDGLIVEDEVVEHRQRVGDIFKK
jgi:putative ABC transport system ATP-binding protein